MDKKVLRRQMREKKSTMTRQQIETASRDLAQQFFRTPAYMAAKTLYGYMPYNQEVQTLPILQQALSDGKRVAVPKLYGNEMRFIYITDFHGLANSDKGIPEPVADGPVADDPTALVLMPGIAFDLQGHRIGYGGGYYDRFLASEPTHPTIALCYDFQVFPKLETEIFDIPVDLVLWTKI